MLSNSYIFLIVFMGILFFGTAVAVLYWCVRNGQFSNFDENSRSIFSDDEPEGVQTDFFPGNKNKIKK